MALYDYACPGCGPFEDWRPMADAAKPAACPVCGKPSPRAITAPNISTMSGNTRIASARNEKSADEPRVVAREKPASGSCHGGHAHSHKSDRPWMIGH